MGFGLDVERFGARFCQNDLSLSFPARTPRCKHWSRHASDTACDDLEQPVDSRDFQRLHLAWKLDALPQTNGWALGGIDLGWPGLSLRAAGLLGIDGWRRALVPTPCPPAAARDGFGSRAGTRLVNRVHERT